MILHGRYGKKLIFWTNSDAVSISLRGAAGTHEWSDCFPLDAALLFFLRAATETALRQRPPVPPVPAAVSAPDGTQP